MAKDQGYLDQVDDDGTVENRVVRNRPARKQVIAQADPAPEAKASGNPPPSEQPKTSCPYCGHPLKNELGLKQHIGKKHKEIA